MLTKPLPILVTERFPALLDSLLDVLETLSAEDWARPTVAAGWSVKDVALHLLGDEIGILSGKRDGFAEPHPPIERWDDLVPWINLRNAQWVEGARRMSPRLLCDLLRFCGEQANQVFAGLDVHALGMPVDWAGEGPAPVWLDIAREFTERWHHQQHIRDALGRPGAAQPLFIALVLATFVFALPRTYQNVAAPDGTCVALAICGAGGGDWAVVREASAWQLYSGKPERADAAVRLPVNTAWRLFTRGLPKERARAELSGNLILAEKLLETISILA